MKMWQTTCCAARWLRCRALRFGVTYTSTLASRPRPRLAIGPLATVVCHILGALLVAMCLAAAPDAPAAPAVTALTIEGDVRVDVAVGGGRGVDVLGSGVEVVGPSDGRLRVTAPLRAAGARPTVRVRVDGPTLEVIVLRGAQLRAAAGRLDGLTLEVRHTSRVDVAALLVRSLTVTASEAARVRARGEQVTLRAERTAQVTLAGKPKKLAQDVRDAARLTIEP